MTVNYNAATINDRLQVVVDHIDAGGIPGFIRLLDSTQNTLVSLQLAFPCGTISAGVLTFGGTLLDAAIASGTAVECSITDSAGTTVASGLTVGIPLSDADVTLSNGSNTTFISSADTVQVLTAQITGV